MSLRVFDGPKPSERREVGGRRGDDAVAHAETFEDFDRVGGCASDSHGLKAGG